MAAAAIALHRYRLGVADLLAGKTQFAVDAPVDVHVEVFGEGLGHLHTEAVPALPSCHQSRGVSCAP